MAVDKAAPGTPLPATSVTAGVGTGYPPAFKEFVEARVKRRLGDVFGLSQFGVNLVTLPPGCWSSQRHWHAREDEFIYVLAGELVLVTDAGKIPMRPGDCTGFPAGTANGHQLINRSDTEAVYLEAGTRSPDEDVDYPDIDLVARKRGSKVAYLNRKGEPY
jgi:uncharacterized cupin superfamily protein